MFKLDTLDPKCPVCEQIAKQMTGVLCREAIIREFGDVRYEFDVSKARTFCENKSPVLVPVLLRDLFLRIGGVTTRHVDHVSTDHPGIIASIQDAVFLIDGHHRASKCKKLDKPFFAYVLTVAESARCTSRSRDCDY